MPLVTYDKQPAENIRYGDIVTDSKGTYTANSNAELDQWGEINVIDDNGRYRPYSKTENVTISFEETEIYS
jgi:hypothetical protein